jgi:hypothetical protein
MNTNKERNHVCYYEEKVIFSRESVIVCVPHNKYSEFLAAITSNNKESVKPVILESLRPNVKRLTKNSISYEDFRGAYF